MPDDPNKRGPQDRARVSKQKYEQAYQRRKARPAGSKPSRGGRSASRSPGR
jgi:hypothetical protein